MKTVMMFLGLWVFAVTSIYAQDQTPPPTPSQEQPEVLTRGPVHEAYAQPVDVNIQQGIVAPKPPPQNIQEAPTTQMPQGGNFVWVPGYWSWDQDRDDYLWVSGCWRAAPPGMSWVPGYWAQTDNGYEWVAGFWTPAGTREIQYLPPPPSIPTVEAPGPPPVEGQIWVPPCQYWYNDRYVLRGGYWLDPQPDWIWTPSHYVWSPRGYIFVEGHWDYTFANRGVLFAPVYWHNHNFAVGFTYSPGIVLDIGALQIGLFAYPRYCHYYFGDYYDSAYLAVGIYPWFECTRYHTWYDPVYFHDRWRHEYHDRDRDWDRRVRRDYDDRRDHRDLRPPRTYREMETRVARAPAAQQKNYRIAEPLTTYEKTSKVKFQQVDKRTREKITTQATSVTKYSTQRASWEKSAPAPKPGGKPSIERKPVPTEGREKATKQPAPAPKETAPAPTERKQPVTTTPERKAPAPPERKEVTPAPQRAPETAPPSQRQPTPSEQREKETIQHGQPQKEAPPAGRKGSVSPTPERKAPTAAPPERKETKAAPGKQQQPEYVPPRQVQTTKPERVKVPESSVTGTPGKGAKGPPSRPSYERQTREEPKGPPRGQPQDRGQDKDQRGNGKGQQSADKGQPSDGKGQQDNKGKDKNR